MSLEQRLAHGENQDAVDRVFSIMKGWYRSVPRSFAKEFGEEMTMSVLDEFEATHRPLPEVLDDDEVHLTELLEFMALFGRKLEVRHSPVDPQLRQQQGHHGSYDLNHKRRLD